MEYTPLQFALGAFEWLVLLAGTVILLRTLGARERRANWLSPNRLPSWPVSGFEASLLFLLVLASMLIFQSAAASLFAAKMKTSPDLPGLELFVYGLAQHGGALLAWPVFAVLRARLYDDHGLPAEPAAAPPPAGRPLQEGLALLLMAVPVIFLVSYLWDLLLVRLGLPDAPQNLVDAFSRTRSPLVIAGMFVVACGVAPVNEEMIFRAGLYRFVRQRLGRTPALAISSLLFGSLHVNWSTFDGLVSFAPLVLLGAVFALIYEKTGRIWVSMLAHALFNLNTVAYVLSGLPQ